MKGFAAIVLAGGGGRRLGDPAKPERAVGGVPMLARVLAAVADASPRVVVGPPRLAALLPPGVILTLEDPPGGGPVAALAAGLTHLDPAPDLIALLAADLPFLTVEEVSRLRGAMATARATGAVLVDGDDRPQWLCGVWRHDALANRLAAIGDAAGQSLRALLAPAEPMLIRSVDDDAAAPAYFDCDTEQDLRRANEWTRATGRGERHDGFG